MYVRSQDSGLNDQAVKAVLLDNLRTLDIVRPTSASNIAHDRVGNIAGSFLSLAPWCADAV